MPFEDIESRLIPYDSREELAERVKSLFDWYDLGDPVPRFYPKDTKLPQGVLLSYPKESWAFTYFPGIEFKDLILSLPQNNEIIKEVLSQAKKNLEEILTKSSDGLKSKFPAHLNSFLVGACKGYEELFPYIKNAADHILTTEPMIEDNEGLKEASIIWRATEGMLGYKNTHKKEVENFLDKLWDKKLALSFVITGYMDIENENAIKAYFELFQTADGEDKFLLKGVQRDISFKFIGRRLKKRFPDYDFSKEIKTLQDMELQNKLLRIFRIK